jgi:hypothetical protein
VSLLRPPSRTAQPRDVRSTIPLSAIGGEAVSRISLEARAAFQRRARKVQSVQRCAIGSAPLRPTLRPLPSRFQDNFDGGPLRLSQTFSRLAALGAKLRGVGFLPARFTVNGVGEKRGDSLP